MMYNRTQTIKNLDQPQCARFDNPDVPRRDPACTVCISCMLQPPTSRAEELQQRDHRRKTEPAEERMSIKRYSVMVLRTILYLDSEDRKKGEAQREREREREQRGEEAIVSGSCRRAERILSCLDNSCDSRPRQENNSKVPRPRPRQTKGTLLRPACLQCAFWWVANYPDTARPWWP